MSAASRIRQAMFRLLEPFAPSFLLTVVGILDLNPERFLLGRWVRMIGSFRDDALQILPAGQLKQRPAMLHHMIYIDEPRGLTAEQNLEVLLTRE